MCKIDEAIRQGLTCPYCLCGTSLVNASEVYDYAYQPGARMYACFDCKAWVGCHKNSTKALGALADADTRTARLTAHNYFDQLWKPPKTGKFLNCPVEYTQRLRRVAYAWLSEAMGLPEEHTHIGMFDVAQCAEVVRLCRQRFKIFA